MVPSRALRHSGGVAITSTTSSTAAESATSSTSATSVENGTSHAVSGVMSGATVGEYYGAFAYTNTMDATSTTGNANATSAASGSAKGTSTTTFSIGPVAPAPKTKKQGPSRALKLEGANGFCPFYISYLCPK
jgi:hypothetical protein